VDVYAKRLTAFAKVENVELKESADKAAEARLVPLVKDWGERGRGRLVVALDERGREWTSVELAAQLRGWQDDPGVKEVLLVIGGPMGLPALVRERADRTWALSKATLTSDMAWLLAWEQVYRAFNILAGTGYHHA
jgi:23S rRNA (pseudouridine1915-N3)-methyltransferase